MNDNSSSPPFRAGAAALLFGLSVGLGACADASAQSSAPPSEEIRIEWPPSTMEAVLGVSAKLLCSEHFIAGRSAEDIARDTLLGLTRAGAYATLPNEYWPYTEERYAAALNDVEIDEASGTVTMRAGPYRAHARYYGDQGCTLLHPLAERAYFEPQPVPRAAPDDRLFPDGGGLLGSDAALPEAYDRDLLEAAAQEALKPESRGAAFLVMHRGQLVVERYAQGVDADTPLLNWSMGKSILATLIGRLDYMGLVSLDEPAPIELWRVAEDDPRQPITLRNLLNMSSGLSCERTASPWERPEVLARHNLIYHLPINASQFAITSRLIHPPGEIWAYSNCDIQAAGHVLRSVVSQDGDYLSWPYAELYNKIGMSGMVSEVDTYGNFHLTGMDYGRARDWARYGLLYLNGGVWNGERLLSEAFVETVATPGEAWRDENGQLSDSPRTYGAGHWLNTGGAFALPRDAFYAYGFSSNYAFIVPSEDLVVVILHLPSLEAEMADTNAVLTPLMAGLGVSLDD